MGPKGLPNYADFVISARITAPDFSMKSWGHHWQQRHHWHTKVGRSIFQIIQNSFKSDIMTGSTSPLIYGKLDSNYQLILLFFTLIAKHMAHVQPKTIGNHSPEEENERSHYLATKAIKESCHLNEWLT